MKKQVNFAGDTLLGGIFCRIELSKQQGTESKNISITCNFDCIGSTSKIYYRASNGNADFPWAAMEDNILSLVREIIKFLARETS
ncbi:MAG: hypothetical protein OXR68_03465 [Alphaproteobacteria bacterium]|nr:hypothetical protein [Alphaproteobacteria bacterium]MDD9919665.1 hypothetical protein [Alphaproteobacteria bacterium]